MYRILIWGLGSKYNLYINAIKYCELKWKEIEIVGVTDLMRTYDCLDGYPFIPLDCISPENIDYIVVTSENALREIGVQAKSLGFAENVLVLGRVFCLPGFRFSSYQKLLSSKISIIANNCWGGFMYHALGMRFYSPFINTSISNESYLKLLGNLKYYLACNLELKKIAYHDELKMEYPVCKLDDVEIHFIHDRTMDGVEEKWQERLKRISWNNLFVMMNTLNRESAEVFETLDYKKKICFVPFETKAKCLNQLYFENVEKNGQAVFGKIVNGIPQGIYQDYDLIELLLTGVNNHSRYYIK